MPGVDALIAEIIAAFRAGEPFETSGMELCELLFAGLAEALGHPLELDPETVDASNRSIIAAGSTRVSDGLSAPLPLSLLERLSGELVHPEGPSILAYVFLLSGEERVAPVGRDFVWYELEQERWVCRGWDVDEFGEWVWW
jgi:hypothetical protein